MAPPKKSWFATVFMTDLLLGLWTTLRYTFKPNVTIRYPLERSAVFRVARTRSFGASEK